MAIKILIGGSPCTYWSIAQTNGRETKAEGMGWELFKNYLIAKEKFKPDFFLYENNKSAAQAIKDQIAEEFGVGTDPAVRFTYINSALVSAQNRQRFYVTNFGDIEQPEDRGILLRDILETGNGFGESDGKSFCMTASYYKGKEPEKVLTRHERTHVIEPVGDTNDKAYCLTANYAGAHPEHTLSKGVRSMVAEPIRIPEYGDEDKARPVNAHYSNNCGGFEHRMFSPNPAKQQVDMIAVPVETDEMIPPCDPRGRDKSRTLSAGYSMCSQRDLRMDIETDGFMGKQGCVEAVDTDSMQPRYIGEVPEHNGVYRNGKQPSQQYRVYDTDAKGVSVTTSAITNVAEPIRVGSLPRPNGELSKSQAMQVYSQDGKSTTQMAGGGGLGGKTGPYAIPVEFEDGVPTKAVSCADGKTYTVYKVVDGKITIKDKEYPIKLKDGYYIIRKLTVRECARLQTMPDDYCKAVSDSQAYKALGNGWTAEVIIHLLNHALKDVPRDEEIVVLSMYDGIATGRYCLDKMGFTNVKYHAYEIDKYPIQVALDNYPDIVEHGDAFAVREDDWQPPQTRSEWLDGLLGDAL